LIGAFIITTLCINIVLRIQLVPALKSVILSAMRTWTRLEPAQKEFQGGTLTMGNFDGLHRGHQALIGRARDCGGPLTVMTFDPHPLQILQPERQITRIFSRADLSEQLPKFGVDLLVILPFTEQLARTGAEDFWRQYVTEPFRPKNIVAGHDFAFGRSRQGTLEFLQDWCARNQAGLHVVKPFLLNGEIVSSRAIRELIRLGEVEKAATYLGRHFYLRGAVGKGAGRGKTIGVPTMNFTALSEILPAHGVYATLTHWQGRRWASVTNIGVNPTFGATEGVKVETHVIGHAVEARGETVDVEFVRRLRPEMKFASIEDLKNQIKDDILKANEALDKFKPNQ